MDAGSHMDDDHIRHCQCFWSPCACHLCSGFKRNLLVVAFHGSNFHCLLPCLWQHGANHNTICLQAHGLESFSSQPGLVKTPLNGPKLDYGQLVSGAVNLSTIVYGQKPEIAAACLQRPATDPNLTGDQPARSSIHSSRDLWLAVHCWSKTAFMIY